MVSVSCDDRAYFVDGAMFDSQTTTCDFDWRETYLEAYRQSKTTGSVVQFVPLRKKMGNDEVAGRWWSEQWTKAGPEKLFLTHDSRQGL